MFFLSQYSTPKQVFISERDLDHDTKKEQALSLTFSRYDWFVSQNGLSWLATTLRDKLTLTDNGKLANQIARLRAIVDLKARTSIFICYDYVYTVQKKELLSNSLDKFQNILELTTIIIV